MHHGGGGREVDGPGPYVAPMILLLVTLRAGTVFAVIVDAVRGLCPPFGGPLRPGATISRGMLAGVSKPRADEVH